MTNLFKRFFTHKSKFLLIIISLLGLAFSYSCSCRNETTKPPVTGDDDAVGTFRASVNADGFSDTLRVNSQNQVHGNSALSIGFTGKNGANKVAFEVHITDILDESTDKPLDFSDDKDNGYSKYIGYNSDTGALTFTKDGLNKIGELDSSTKPQDRKVKITFKLDSDESLDLKNSSTNFTKEFHLIKIKKIEEKDIDTILHKIDSEAKHPFRNGSVGNYVNALFNVNNGTYKTGIYEIPNETTEQNKMTTFESKDITNIKEILDYYLPKLDEISGVKQGKEDGEAGKDNYYKVTYDITWGDNFESTITSIPFRYTL